LDVVDDSKEYIATRRAMEIVGISAEEQVYGTISQRQCL
jgi:myosin-5